MTLLEETRLVLPWNQSRLRFLSVERIVVVESPTWLALSFLFHLSRLLIPRRSNEHGRFSFLQCLLLFSHGCMVVYIFFLFVLYVKRIFTVFSNSAVPLVFQNPLIFRYDECIDLAKVVFENIPDAKESFEYFFENIVREKYFEYVVNFPSFSPLYPFPSVVFFFLRYTQKNCLCLFVFAILRIST